MQLVNHSNLYLHERSWEPEPITLPQISDDIELPSTNVNVTSIPSNYGNLEVISGGLIVGAIAILVVGLVAPTLGTMIGIGATVDIFASTLADFALAAIYSAIEVYFIRGVLKSQENNLGWRNFFPEFIIRQFFPDSTLSKRSITDDSENDISSEVLEMIRKELTSSNDYLNISTYEKNNNTIIEAKIMENSSFILNLFENNTNHSIIPSSIYYHFKSEDIKVQDIDLDKTKPGASSVDKTILKQIENFASDETFKDVSNHHTMNGNNTSTCVKIPVSKSKQISMQIDLNGLQNDNSCL